MIAERPALLLARALEGIWRAEPPPPHGDFEALAPILSLTDSWGITALLWPRFRAVDRDDTLRNAARIATLRYGRNRNAVEAIEERLGAAGIPHLHFKGRAVAALYAHPELRPLGSDSDIIVPPGREEEARRIMAQNPGHNVDTHHPFVTQSGVSWEEMLACSVQTEIMGIPVRTLGPEHHLAAVTENALRHGIRNPTALIDIAVLAERFGPTIRWDLLAHRPLRPWVATALGLTGAIAGASLASVPYSRREITPRPWMLRSVFGAWEDPARTDPGDGRPHNGPRRTPAEMIAALRRHWPLPLQSLHYFGLLNVPPAAPAAQFAFYLVGKHGSWRRSRRRAALPAVGEAGRLPAAD